MRDMRRELVRTPSRSSTYSGSSLHLLRSFDPYVDRRQRLTQVVPHDCDEPFPQLGRLFSALPLLLGFRRPESSLPSPMGRVRGSRK